jgi:hypothetical protein
VREAGHVRILLDEARDEATIAFTDERQSYENGSTHTVLANTRESPYPESIEVQLGFEDERRLLFILVRPASVALPQELRAQAERR